MVTNNTILELLCAYFHTQRRKSDKYIHVLQFAYNHKVQSAAIGKAPFEIVFERCVARVGINLLFVLCLYMHQFVKHLLKHKHNTPNKLTNIGSI